jgi:hypothetical protein
MMSRQGCDDASCAGRRKGLSEKRKARPFLLTLAYEGGSGSCPVASLSPTGLTFTYKSPTSGSTDKTVPEELCLLGCYAVWLL